MPTAIEALRHYRQQFGLPLGTAVVALSLLLKGQPQKPGARLKREGAIIAKLVRFPHNTFEVVPDAPVSRFVLEMQGGKKGLIVNSTNLCASTNRAKAHLSGQNGKVDDFKPLVRAECGKQHKKKQKSRHKRAHHHR